jgi:hypothetical protein
MEGMIMKKTVLIGAVSVLLTLLAFCTGCASTGIATDITRLAPASERCVLNTDLSLTFDGKKLDSYSMGTDNIFVLAGEHTVSYTSGVEEYRLSSGENSYTYMPYRIRANNMYDFKPQTVYEVTIYQSTLPVRYERSGTNSGRLVSTRDDVVVRLVNDVFEISGPVLRITEKKSYGALFVAPESHFGGQTAMIGYTYPAAINIFEIDYEFGIAMVANDFHLKLLAETNVPILNMAFLTIPEPLDSGGMFGADGPLGGWITLGWPFHVGGFAQFYFPKVGFGFGGGMAAIVDINKGFLYSPYAELQIIPKGTKYLAFNNRFYIQYYFDPTREIWGHFGIGYRNRGL